MPGRTLQLEFPAAGVVRRLGVRAGVGGAAPFPTPWCVNCRLEDSLTNRLRGGNFAAAVSAAEAASARPTDITYRDRTLTVDSTNDNAVKFSRVGDGADTTLTGDVHDGLRPALVQFSEADQTGQTVVALVPHKDQFLLAFTTSETWILAGTPHGGAIRRISDEVGIVGANAWCVAHDTVYFLSSLGLYAVGADGSGMKPISEDKVPEDLTGVTDAATILTYNHADRGVYVHKTSTDWFYDVAREGFWPFDESTTASHVLLGPFVLGRDGSYGRIQSLHGNMAASSADVAWRIVPGDTAEEAADNGKLAITAALALSSYSDYVSGEGTWSAGRSHVAYPRTRAMWACLWLSASSDWGYETAVMRIEPSARWR